MKKVKKTEEEWKKELTPENYKILREKATETPFTGKLLHNKKTGMYVCGACGNELFSSKDKYDSGCGWPSFTKPASKENVEMKPDNGLLMKRTEIVCNRCGSHLGHVFDDGPEPTGKRFCVNSGSLKFKEKKDYEEG